MIKGILTRLRNAGPYFKGFQALAATVASIASIVGVYFAIAALMDLPPLGNEGEAPGRTQPQATIRPRSEAEDLELHVDTDDCDWGPTEGPVAEGVVAELKVSFRMDSNKPADQAYPDTFEVWATSDTLPDWRYSFTDPYKDWWQDDGTSHFGGDTAIKIRKEHLGKKHNVEMSLVLDGAEDVDPSNNKDWFSLELPPQPPSTEELLGTCEPVAAPPP